MTDFVSINGQIVNRFSSGAEVVSSSRLYGKGVFSTVAIVDGKPVFWEKHWRRLTVDAAKVGVDISMFSDVSTANHLATLIERNELANGRARITFSDDSPGRIWSSEHSSDTRLTIVSGPPREVGGRPKLTISPHRITTTSPLAAVKSCNYLEPLMAYENARSERFDEAVRLNEHGDLVSACMANVFWLTRERLFTPSLQTGCLAGTTREFILENLECEEVEAGIEALHKADEVFLTSAGIGAIQAAELDSRKLRGAGHPILNILPF